MGLGPARVNPEPGDDLVEDQRRAAVAGDPAQLDEELARLQIRPPALDRLDQNSRELVRALAKRVERARVPVVENQRVRHHALGDAGRGRCTGGVGQRLAHVAVVGAAEEGDPAATGGGARQAQRDHHRLGAAVHEGDALGSGELVDETRDLTGERAVRAQEDALLELPRDGLGDEAGVVPEEVHAEAHREIDILVAVDVPEPGAARTLGDERIDHLLGRAAKPGRQARIGQPFAIRLDERLRASGPANVARRQLGEVRARARVVGCDVVGRSGVLHLCGIVVDGRSLTGHRRQSLAFERRSAAQEGHLLLDGGREDRRAGALRGLELTGEDALDELSILRLLSTEGRDRCRGRYRRGLGRTRRGLARLDIPSESVDGRELFEEPCALHFDAELPLDLVRELEEDHRVGAQFEEGGVRALLERGELQERADHPGEPLADGASGDRARVRLPVRRRGHRLRLFQMIVPVVLVLERVGGQSDSQPARQRCLLERCAREEAFGQLGERRLVRTEDAGRGHQPSRLHRAERIAELDGGARDHRQPVLEGGAAGVGGVAEIAERGLRVLAEKVAVAAHLARECALAARRQREEVGCGRRRARIPPSSPAPEPPSG